MTPEGTQRVFIGEGLHIHISGGIAAALTPWWINWLRSVAPHVRVSASVSPRAQRFVSLAALQALTNGELWSDEWDATDLPKSWRNGGSLDADCIIVFPASLDTVMRLAQGRADSPALMMLQITRLPVILADVFPTTNEVIDHWRSLLARRPNIVFAPRVDAQRADTRDTTTSGFNLPGAIEIANAMMTDR